jgi:hypothetical protein
MNEKVRQGKNARPREPDEPAKRLSTDEPLWDAAPAPKRAAPGVSGPVRGPAEPARPGATPAGSEPPAASAPPPGPRPPRPEATGPRRFWRRSEFRVNAVLAAAAVLLLVVGFGLGAALTRDPAPAAPPASAGVQRPRPTSPPSRGTARQAAPPQSCMVAMERADQVISYLVARIRDRRLSASLQAFINARRACQQAAR